MRCEFCGRELETRRALGLRFAIPVPCECDGAKRQREEEDRAEAEANRREVLGRAFERACIPPAMTLYPEWGDGTPVYLYGEQGRGKTEMACGALRRFLREGVVEIDRKRYFETRNAKFVTGPAFMMRLRKTMDVRGESESDLLESYAGVGLLCLDDLGKGKLTDWVLERIYLILDMRYQRNAPTIITSQYDLDALTRLFAAASDMETAAAIRSRIEGMCRPVRIGGPDWRTRR